MSNIFFTADCHFNHGNIIPYASRPFMKKDEIIPGTLMWKNDTIKTSRTHQMNEEIIKRWNNKVNNDSIVYHVGDFCFKENVNPASYFESRLRGKIIHIIGNHDHNNGVKGLITTAFMEFGNRLFQVQHRPPTVPGEIPDFVDCVLCGHVHDLWKTKIEFGVPIINVGVDVWQFTPVSIESLLKLLKRL